MDQTHKDDGFDSESLIEHDEDIDEMIDWEEDLENQFNGGSHPRGGSKKDMGHGFSKQKQIMEENDYYQNSGNKKNIHIKDRTKRK